MNKNGVDSSPSVAPERLKTLADGVFAIVMTLLVLELAVPVVTGADREMFWELVESSLVEERLPSPGSAKSLSKRTRWV